MSLFVLAQTQVQQALAHNQFLSGGLVLGVIGGAAAWGRQLPKRLLDFGLSQFTVSLEIRSSDEAFPWFREWLNEHPYSKRSRHHVLMTRRAKDEDASSSGGGATPSSETSGRRHLLFLPAPGNHWFWSERRFYHISLEYQVPSKENDYKGNEVLRLKTWGRRTEVFRELVGKIQKEMEVEGDRGLRVYVPESYGSYWTCADTRPRRALASLVYEDGLLENVIADVGQFLVRREWYQSKGIPWRRGFLLHGPAGTGKTSLCAAVANAHRLDVYYLSLAKTTDEKVTALLTEIPARAVVVIEEIDTIFHNREQVDGNGITFGGLLNALDGIVSKEGRIVFMTTNHPEKLDPALVRPGRCDRRIELGPATKSQVRRQLQRFYEDANPLEIEAVVALVPHKAVSMAQLQEHCLEHVEDLAGFKADIVTLLSKTRPADAA